MDTVVAAANGTTTHMETGVLPNFEMRMGEFISHVNVTSTTELATWPRSSVSERLATMSPASVDGTPMKNGTLSDTLNLASLHEVAKMYTTFTAR